MKHLLLICLSISCLIACKNAVEPEPEPEPEPERSALEQNACFFEFLDEAIGADGRLLAPNIFTPDDDGINDVFQVSLEAPDSIKSTFSMTVFDSTGTVFTAAELDEVWQGTLQNGDPAPAGIYNFNVNLLLDDTFTSFNSQVTLIRVSGPNAKSYDLQRCGRCVFPDEIDPSNGAVSETLQPLEDICP